MIASDFPSLAYDGKPTFAGLLHRYFTELDSHKRNVGISRSWNEKTAEQCRYDYERRILPALYSFVERDTPAHELTGELFELVLQKLADERNYSDGTIAHYRHLILLAYQAGSSTIISRTRCFGRICLTRKPPPTQKRKPGASIL